MKLYHIVVLPLLLFSAVYGQSQTITSKIVDGKTKNPIPYVTIQYGENRGVISNEEGRFSFVIDSTTQKLDSIYISSMGYEKLGFTYGSLLDSIIYIQPKAIELGGVYLFDKELEVHDIIDKMKERLPQNINNEPVKQRYFLRQSVLGNVEKVDFGFEKSSIEEFDEEFIDSLANIIPRNSYHYTEALGDFYKTNKAYKVNVLKAANLYDKNDIGSFDELGKRMETIFKQNVKPDSYLKIKSGWFSQKIQVDSILSEIEEEKAKELEKEIKKDTISSLVDNQKHIFDELLGEVFYQENTKLNVVNKSKKYKFELAGYADIDDAGVYVVDFKPKGGADFKGRLFINIEDFAIMRIDFENLKNLKNFRLLGVFYREILYKGSMHFIKLSNNRYDLKFADFSFGRWFRFDRPLDVIEKNKHVRGRNKQNELRLNIDFRVTNTNKWELVVFENTIIDQNQFDNFKEDKSVKATYLAQYDPEFWKGYNIMEPNQAIKEFTASEEN